MKSNILIAREKRVSKLSKDLRLPLKLSLFISILMIIIAIVMYGSLQPEIPIFYSLPKSPQQLAHKVYIFLIPTISLVITISHFSLLLISKEIEKRLRKMFGWATVILQIIALLIFLRIIFIIT